MAEYYLAVDIGASSGRHILGCLEDGKLKLEEVYRFKNGVEERNGHLCWNLDRLFTEIKAGLKKCKEIGKIPVSMGIDTWGVDFVLLDAQDRVLGNTVAYRDSRTEGMPEEVDRIISYDALYGRTGIQRQPINTIYQFYAIKKTQPELLEQAEAWLMVPSYFNFLLTGVKLNEYTNISTTGLLNAETKDWDMELIGMLGLPQKLFQPFAMPKTAVGQFTEAVAQEVGFDCTVILPATHDTGSAVLAAPMAGEDCIYISSGTWSLMGVESRTANCSAESCAEGLTNEGGVEYRYRQLKNIMGLWIIQSIRKELGEGYSFNDLENAAKEYADFQVIFDVNDGRFLAPKSMIGAIRSYCEEHKLPVPKEIGELMQCAYLSLAHSYAETVCGIEKVNGRLYHKINIVGGGCQDGYLNMLTARMTGKEVYAGPVEATAIGNILAQMLAGGTVGSVEAARALVGQSFAVKAIKI